MKKPDWLKVQYNKAAVEEIAGLMNAMGLNTVCKEANCPNMGECFHSHTATFMVMGSQCTRNCRFCNVTCGRAEPLDPEEPERVAQAVREMGLHHAVITQVTRDDLPDGGAAHMAATVRAIKALCPETTVETLISDLKGDENALKTVLDAQPDVLGHNVEMVSQLYRFARPQAIYERSLKVLADSKRFVPGIFTKTGIMLGLGETEEQVDVLLNDIRATGCDILTISQYLQPSQEHWELARYYTPEEFEQLKAAALEKGFRFVASGPLVRSSYRAAEALAAAQSR